jgi:hypothetical protein
MKFFMSALRVAIAVAVVNATGRAALAYWSHYQFQDAAQQLAIFGWQSPPDVVRTHVFAKAVELLIPITEEQIVVTRDGALTLIRADYKHPVEYFPHQMYPLKLSFKVEGRNMITAQ